MCYVGKATKIFVVVIGILAILGLILGVSLANRSWGRKAQPLCQSPNCRPIYADPLPADASAAPNPTTSTTPPPLNPIINPTTTPTANPTTASANSAAPPPLVGFAPPSPFSFALGPVHG